MRHQRRRTNPIPPGLRNLRAFGGGGIAIGFISYAFAKLISGKASPFDTLRASRPAVVYVFAALFVLQYAIGMMTGALH